MILCYCKQLSRDHPPSPEVYKCMIYLLKNREVSFLLSSSLLLMIKYIRMCPLLRPTMVISYKLKRRPSDALGEPGRRPQGNLRFLDFLVPIPFRYPHDVLTMSVRYSPGYRPIPDRTVSLCHREGAGRLNCEHRPMSARSGFLIVVR